MEHLLVKYNNFLKFLKEQNGFAVLDHFRPNADIYTINITNNDLDWLKIKNESDILKICAKLEKEKVISSFKFDRRPLRNYVEQPVWDESQMAFIIESIDLFFTNAQLDDLKNLSKKNVDIDFKDGTLKYKNITVKFRRDSKQSKILGLLFLNRRTLVSFEKIAFELYNLNSQSVSATIKKEIYDNFFVIKKKLKKYKIPISIFLETDNGYGLK